MARGLEKPPWWAVVVMVVAAVGLAVGLPFALHRSGDPLSKAEAARLADAEQAAERSAAMNAPIKVLVVGDSYTAGSDMGGHDQANWTSVVTQHLTSAGYRIALTVSAGGGSGYTAPGSSNKVFQQLLDTGGSGYDLIVFFGSRNDQQPTTVQAAAAAAFADAKKKSPAARLLVIGPPWVNGNPPAYIQADRSAVATAARGAGATFLDPLADGWFTGADSALIGSDGVHPTDAGHAYMAARIEPAMKAQLDAIRSARG